MAATHTTTTYRIGEAAALAEVSTDTLRYYEKEGLIPGIPRADNGHRRYDDGDVQWIRLLCALRATGMPISGLRQFVELASSGDDTIEARCRILDEHRAAMRDRIEQLESHLRVLDNKRQFYAGTER